MGLLTALVISALFEAVTVVGPAYPPNAFMGGTVVAVMHVAAGSVSSVDVLQGDEPFVDAVRSALSSWRFKGSENDDVLAVVNFRSPTLYAAGSATRNLEIAQPVTGLARPQKVVEPAYPPNSLGEGSVVLRLSVSETGSVSKISVVQGLGGLTDPCVSAANKWQFSPARSAEGVASLSEVYAVCVVRRPVLSSRLPE